MPCEEPIACGMSKRSIPKIRRPRRASCVVVARGEPCLGPVTRTGCGALCPSFNRGCYGCFGPANDRNMESFARMMADCGVTGEDAMRRLRGINGYVSPWRETADAFAAKK